MGMVMAYRNPGGVRDPNLLMLQFSRNFVVEVVKQQLVPELLPETWGEFYSLGRPGIHKDARQLT